MLRTQIEVSDLFFKDITWYRPIEMEGSILHIDVHFRPLLDEVRELVTDKEPVACVRKDSELYKELLTFYGTEEMIHESSRVIYETSEAIYMYVKEDEEFFSIVHEEGEEALFIRFLLHGALSGECEYFRLNVASGIERIVRAANEDVAYRYMSEVLNVPVRSIEPLGKEENSLLFDEYFNFKVETPTLALPSEAIQIIAKTQNV